MPEGDIIYIVTRLFDFAEKLKAESVEQAVLKGIQTARNASIQHAHTLSTFVPFRDTAQDTLRGPKGSVSNPDAVGEICLMGHNTPD